MSQKQHNSSDKDTRKENQEPEIKIENADVETDDVLDEGANEVCDTAVDDEESSEIETLKQLLQQRDEALEKEKKEYLFLMADFDNFKKRTLREKSEIIKNGAENVLKGILPILDDFERGIDAIKDDATATSVKEGMELIYNKFVKYLQQNGVKEIPTEGADFDVDLHEAIAMVPVDDESKKGKVIDTIAKGYTLNDKVIRHAKVAVGQ
ncbi:MAG: nucleotide exchange factor GrpE [Barnesiella sp.]|nr:nucleotide exchange factor GrpE [Bacteroidales bacterium]MBD5247675.1 nucleotide exchange factor GrpE [Barnesiella sp.]MBD5258914.1 nucleotide exchange factor GrpE [Barnesiella sp.]